jgi:integrase
MPGLARLGDALRQEDKDSMPAAAFTFMLLTGCRPGEALKARWAAIDLEARIWHLPGSKAFASWPPAASSPTRTTCS